MKMKMLCLLVVDVVEEVEEKLDEDVVITRHSLA
jgi:hypothetical protein